MRHCAVCRILVSRPGIKQVPPAMEVWSLNHWTVREIPIKSFNKRKLSLSSKNQDLVKLNSSTMSFTAFDEAVVILMHMVFWYCIVKCVNLWQICITQWTTSFQMIQNHTMAKDPLQLQGKFFLTENRKLIDMFQVPYCS